MNKEYVDEDELAKKIVFDRTLRFVNNLYGDEPEVSLQQDQLTPHNATQLRHIVWRFQRCH